MRLTERRRELIPQVRSVRNENVEIKSSFRNVFVKSGPIYVKPRPKCFQTHSTHRRLHLTNKMRKFCDICLSVCLSHTFNLLGYLTYIRGRILRRPSGRASLCFYSVYGLNVVFVIDCQW